MKHLKILAILNYVGVALYLMAMMLMLAAGGAAFAFGDLPEDEMVMVGATLGATMFILMGVTVLCLVAGRKISRGRGRMLQTILGVLSLGKLSRLPLRRVRAVGLLGERGDQGGLRAGRHRLSPSRPGLDGLIALSREALRMSARVRSAAER